MRYLLEALEADRERYTDLKKVYAFAEAKDDDQHLQEALWRAKGVDPILYHVGPDGSHADLYRTLREWCRNLDEHWDAAVEEVGLGTARVWALYLAGSRIGFEINQIQLHQVLAVKTVDGVSGFPLRPTY